MEKENFWAKLKKEDKLKMVEPSDEIKESYIKKSESNALAAKILFDNNMLEEAVTIIYYSMYNILTALFFKAGIKSENHNASILILSIIFGKDNRLISHAKKERIDKQYYVDFNISMEQVMETIKEAEEFNSELLDYIEKIPNNEVQLIRKKFSDFLKKY